MVNFYPCFLIDDCRTVNATVKDVVKHINHIRCLLYPSETKLDTRQFFTRQGQHDNLNKTSVIRKNMKILRPCCLNREAAGVAGGDHIRLGGDYADYL